MAVRGPGKRNGLCRGSELCGVVEGSGRGTMGEDEAGGVVGDSGLTRLTCLPDGACLRKVTRPGVHFGKIHATKRMN